MKKLILILMALFLWAGSSWAQTITIGTQVVASGTSSIGPTNYYWESRHIQWVITATEISTAGGSAGDISSMAYDVSQIAGGNLLNYTIRMAHTTAIDASTHNAVLLTTVKNAHTFVPGATGWRTISFDANFPWDGVQNILVDVCWGVNTGYSSTGQVWLYNNVVNQMRGITSSSANQCGVATTTTRSGKPRVQLTILSGACAGTPAPGLTISSANPVCSGVNFNLSLQNSTPGSGVTYQWQYGPSNTGPWTPFGPNASTATTSQIADTWYQCVVTCTNSGYSGTSTPLQVTLNPFYNCYCTPTTTSGCTGDYISNVNFNGINRTSACDGTGINYYNTPNPSIAQGTGYTLSVTTGGDNEGVRAWIDWNQDGTFDNTTELVLGPSYLGTNPATYSITVNVPGTATLGETRLRVRCSYAAAPVDPCANQSYGEAEDYLVTVIVATSPTLSVVPNTINFGTVPSGSYGYNQYVLSGINLTGYPDNIVVTASVGFEVSNDNSNWYGTVNVPYTGATLPNTTVYARFAPSGPPNAYSGNITNVGGGTKASANVAVNGSSWIITPTFTCQTIAGTFPTTGIKIGVVMTTANAYDFSCCVNDATCAGSAGTGNDIDFTMYGTDGTTQLWYIDGASSCGYNASTWGSAYNAWVPPANGTYYLQIDDYSNIAGSFIMGYIASIPTTTSTWTGLADTDWDNTGNWNPAAIPTNTVKVIIPAGCPNYPYIDALAACNKLTINSGGSLYMIDSFFDIFTELSCSGTLNISGGTMDVTNNLYLPTTTSTLIMSNGTLNVGGIFQNAANTWSNGLYTLSGGTINMSGTAFFSGGTGSTMSGNFVFNVGGTLQIPSTMWTMTGGTINLLGTETTTNYFLPPSATGTAVAYNLNVNSGASSYVFARDASINLDAIANNFSIQSGTVNLASTLGTGYPGTFTVGGNMDVAANNTANLSIPAATTFNVAGSANQSLNSPGGYGSVIGNINGLYNLNISFPGLGAGRWVLISPPVSGFTAAMFGCQYLQRHDPITNTWIDMIPSEPLVPGIDYALWVHPDPIVIPPDPNCGTSITPLTSFTWSGVMNSSTVTVPLLSDDVDPLNPPWEGWNNVGNPFQATIDWNSISLGKVNVNDAVYIENNGSWASYVGGAGSNGGTQYIAPGQGFFVECTDIAGGSLVFDPAIRTHTRATFFKNSIPNLVRLKATGNDRSDETVIRFHENSTNGFDGKFDAHKMLSDVDIFPQIPQIYSLDNNKMSINTLLSADKVALGFSAGMDGTYTISATEINDLTNVLLEDLTNHQITDLQSSSYTFDYHVGDNDARFILHFAPVGINDPVTGSSVVYADRNQVIVLVPENIRGTVQITNVLGQEITTSTITNAMNRFHVPGTGYYIVKVQTGDTVISKKVFIQ